MRNIGSRNERRVRKESAGNMVQSEDYNVRLCHQNQQRFISLQSANKALAAQRARHADLLLKSSDWEALWEKYKVRQFGKEAMTCDCTIGGFFERI
jgi:hypothetical protein